VTALERATHLLVEEEALSHRQALVEGLPEQVVGEANVS
jgi:hypothetical protein